MRILVTGGTQFVSKYVAEYFSTNNEVYVLNRGNRKQLNNVKLIKADRNDLGNVLKNYCFDLVIDITSYTQTDTKNLIDALGEFNNFVFISSSAVYPETNKQPFYEEQECGYNSIWGDYGFNKWKAEEYLKVKVPNAYILRPPYLYGKYENLYRSSFVFECALKNRKFFSPQNKDMNLQFLNVFDLCRMIETITRIQPKQHIFNVGNNQLISIEKWVEICYNIVGSKLEFKYLDESINQRSYFPFYNYEYVLDVSKQNEIIDCLMPIEKGLREEFNWYKQNTDCISRKDYFSFIDNLQK